MSNSFFIFYFINTYSAVTYKRRYPLSGCFGDLWKTGYPLSRTDPCTGTENRVPPHGTAQGTAREKHGTAQHRQNRVPAYRLTGVPSRHDHGTGKGKGRAQKKPRRSGTCEGVAGSTDPRIHTGDHVLNQYPRGIVYGIKCAVKIVTCPFNGKKHVVHWVVIRLSAGDLRTAPLSAGLAKRRPRYDLAEVKGCRVVPIFQCAVLGKACEVKLAIP